MADLAELAGVAKITVSRALAGSPAVRPEVRRRIEDLAAEYGYRINASAQSLRRQRTDSIAAVIEMNPSTERPMFEPLVLMVIGAMLQEATLAGYRWSSPFDPRWSAMPRWTSTASWSSARALTMRRRSISASSVSRWWCGARRSPDLTTA